MLKIHIKNLKLYGYHGVRDYEKKDGQYFLFNFEILIKDSDYTGRDELENTLSYSDVIREVKKILALIPDLKNQGFPLLFLKSGHYGPGYLYRSHSFGYIMDP